MPIPALGNLAWHESWAGFGEGSFTLLAKLRALNSLGMKSFGVQFGWSRYVSFLIDARTTPTPVSQRINAASVQAQLGPIFADAAAREHLRFCRSCLRSGYHAASFQLDIFERCLIHHEPLLHHCNGCNSSTPAYAFVTPGGFPSFTCSHCSLSLAGGKNLDKYPGAWSEPESLDEVRSFHAWAASVQSRVKLPRRHSWITCEPESASVWRATLVSVLSHIEPCPQRLSFRHAEVELFPSIEVRTSGAPRNQSYVSVVSSTLPKDWQESDFFWKGWAEGANRLRVPVELDVSVERHATYIWRSQFESYGQIVWTATLEAAEVGQIDEFFSRFASAFLTPGSKFASEGYFQLAHVIWLAAFKVASAWRAHLEDSIKRRQSPPLNAAWLSRLGRWDLQTASPIGVAQIITPSGEQAVRLFLR